MILQGDCLQTLPTLPDKSVHCVVTSPPFWGLRSYLDDKHDDKHLELGMEATPDLYVAKMVEVFREVWRVMRDDATLWLNLGDTYNSRLDGSHGGWNGDAYDKGNNPQRVMNSGAEQKPRADVKPKNLCGIPWRVALALQADGWYLRQDIIWHKPNPMPESVTDRCTKAHEYIFLLTKKARYYYDAEAIKEPAAYAGQMRGGSTNRYEQNNAGMDNVEYSSRNKRSVWTVNTHSFPDAHFATFPPKLIEPCILAGTSEKGCCPECGAPWERIIEKHDMPSVDESKLDRFGDGTAGVHRKVGGQYQKWLDANPTKTLGWQPTCECVIYRLRDCTPDAIIGEIQSYLETNNEAKM